MAKMYQVKREINGKEYIFQHNGLTALLKAQDSCYIDGTDTRSSEKFTNYLFENVIVEPKGLTADDFETIDELNDVIGFAADVMQGKHKNLAIGAAQTVAAPANEVAAYNAGQPIAVQPVVTPVTY